MSFNPPANAREIIQILLRGYQFSESDLLKPRYELFYNTLMQNFAWFCEHLAISGFTLVEDQGVFFLEKEAKVLSQEEKQAVVVLFLLTDLWLEKGKSFADLFLSLVDWTGLDWFRDGYGTEYLNQVGITRHNEDAIEALFKRLSNKGFLDYVADTRTLTLRKPAERLINMARTLHQQIRAEDSALSGAADETE